ncbi:uncharacterized protein KGF55_003425 [Candida pseudojiufengensis]|uniref:uncharacterized protein n=1 Tax=Candida pseudojiufengensis TaxID=497109 RepID=UPI0022250178|nr:uncharacterized protein KGF55_003425 [Candida pseudojiufengensis]KAI5962349.1 hypothetical protein KGF55_003425 [Candida pseudojiufengensis]
MVPPVYDPEAKIYTCRICNTNFKDQASYETHEKSHHKNLKKRPLNKSELERKILDHKKLGPIKDIPPAVIQQEVYTCQHMMKLKEVCGKSFGDEWDYKNHFRESHLLIVCEHCGDEHLLHSHYSHLKTIDCIRIRNSKNNYDVFNDKYKDANTTFESPLNLINFDIFQQFIDKFKIPKMSKPTEINNPHMNDENGDSNKCANCKLSFSGQFGVILHLFKSPVCMLNYIFDIEKLNELFDPLLNNITLKDALSKSILKTPGVLCELCLKQGLENWIDCPDSHLSHLRKDHNLNQSSQQNHYLTSDYSTIKYCCWFCKKDIDNHNKLKSHLNECTMMKLYKCPNCKTPYCTQKYINSNEHKSICKGILQEKLAFKKRITWFGLLCLSTILNSNNASNEMKEWVVKKLKIYENQKFEHSIDSKGTFTEKMPKPNYFYERKSSTKSNGSSFKIVSQNINNRNKQDTINHLIDGETTILAFQELWLPHTNPISNIDDFESYRSSLESQVVTFVRKAWTKYVSEHGEINKRLPAEYKDYVYDVEFKTESMKFILINIYGKIGKQIEILKALRKALDDYTTTRKRNKKFELKYIFVGDLNMIRGANDTLFKSRLKSTHIDALDRMLEKYNCCDLQRIIDKDGVLVSNIGAATSRRLDYIFIDREYVNNVIRLESKFKHIGTHLCLTCTMSLNASNDNFISNNHDFEIQDMIDVYTQIRAGASWDSVMSSIKESFSDSVDISSIKNILSQKSKELSDLITNMGVNNFTNTEINVGTGAFGNSVQEEALVEEEIVVDEDEEEDLQIIRRKEAEDNKVDTDNVTQLDDLTAQFEKLLIDEEESFMECDDSEVYKIKLNPLYISMMFIETSSGSESIEIDSNSDGESDDKIGIKRRIPLQEIKNDANTEERRNKKSKTK